MRAYRQRFRFIGISSGKSGAQRRVTNSTKQQRIEQNAIKALQRLSADLNHAGKDISSLIFYRDVAHATYGVMARSKVHREDGLFAQWFVGAYASTMLVGVRRQCDCGDDCASLCKVMMRIVNGAPSLHNKLTDFRGVKSVQHDIDKLKECEKGIKKYANHFVAHLDRNTTNVPRTPKLKEIDKCLKLLTRLLEKYTLIVDNTALEARPHIGDSWKCVFYEPWIKTRRL
jgi:hypothetical protein